GGKKWTSTARQVSVELAPDGREMAVDVGGRLVRVHRNGGASATRIEDGIVLLEGERAGADAVFAARAHGVEELSVVRRRSELPVYDFDLPHGWRLARARGFEGLVEVLDPRGVPVVRFVSRSAWAGDG